MKRNNIIKYGLLPLMIIGALGITIVITIDVIKESIKEVGTFWGLMIVLLPLSITTIIFILLFMAKDDDEDQKNG